MSTRAVITFKDTFTQERHSVYQHCGGYPSGVLVGLQQAETLAWPLPRFEANDFAAAYVAANKTGGGGIRLCKSPASVGDAAFRYSVTFRAGSLQIIIYTATTTGQWVACWKGDLSALAHDVDAGVLA